jgi:hypothetical protein
MLQCSLSTSSTTSLSTVSLGVGEDDSSFMRLGGRGPLGLGLGVFNIHGHDENRIWNSEIREMRNFED